MKKNYFRFSPTSKSTFCQFEFEIEIEIAAKFFTVTHSTFFGQISIWHFFRNKKKWNLKKKVSESEQNSSVKVRCRNYSRKIYISILLESHLEISSKNIHF